jgi:hypothetical protein
MSITANIVPSITGNLKRKAIKLASQKNYPQLTQKLTMTDESDRLDLFIGIFYLDIVKSD